MGKGNTFWRTLSSLTRLEARLTRPDLEGTNILPMLELNTGPVVSIDEEERLHVSRNSTDTSRHVMTTYNRNSILTKQSLPEECNVLLFLQGYPDQSKKESEMEPANDLTRIGDNSRIATLCVHGISRKC